MLRRFRMVCVLILTGAMFAAIPARADDTLSIDIYAIPSRPIVDAVARVSGQLAASGMTSFYRQGHAVHATLYLTRYPASATPELKAAIARIAKGRRAFPLSVSGLEVTPSNWLFLNVQRSARLQRLADLVTLAAEPLRDHHVTPPAWMSAYPAKLPAFERYGSPNVFMQFDPHLTLLANERNPALASFVKSAATHPPVASGTVDGIGIAVVDGNGQIVRTLAEYRFAPRRE